MKKPEYLGDAMKLFLITLVAGVCLGAAYEITKAPIAAAAVKTEQTAYGSVFPGSGNTFEENAEAEAKIPDSASEISGKYANVVIEKVIDVKDSGGKLIGHVVNSTGKGYGGDVKITVGIKADGSVTGIGFLSLSESPGLGMNAEKPDFYEQFSNKKAEEFSVTKTGSSKDGEINAISGATRTSRAVTNAVNGALYFVKNVMKQGEAG